MKTIIPKKEVELCDICERDGYLKTCKSCGRVYCLTCEGIVPGCIHAMDVCRICDDDERVRAVSEKYAPRITSILKERDQELNSLRRADDERSEL